MDAYLVIGGFEPSGHDATTEAVVAAGVSRNHKVDTLCWREMLSLGNHPMFVSHRYAAAYGASEIAGLLDEPWIGEVLAADLAERIPTGYKAYISVHPWSSLIAAASLRRRDDNATMLVDYHSDFGPFPVVSDPRINAYLGGGRIRSLAPAIRARCHIAGVAVPPRFHVEEAANKRDSLLVVSAGSDGWAVRAMQQATVALVSHLTPNVTILLAPSVDAAAAWKEIPLPGAHIETSLSDISSLLKTARWYLSKGGGTAVAEGIAAGCLGFVTNAGIFWEDEAARHLYSDGIVSIIRAGTVTGNFDPRSLDAARRGCRAAANRVWELIETGLPPRRDAREEAVLEQLLKNIDDHGVEPLPITGEALRQRLDVWRAGWIQ